MPPRRLFLVLGATALVAGRGLIRPAAAQSASDAAAFIKATGEALVKTVDSSGSTEQKAKDIARIIDQRVDVNGIARFCLGRFWRTASPSQQQEYLDLFRQVLVRSIDSKMGEYKGVSFTIGRTVGRETGQVVSTVITRPNQPPADVDWVVQQVDGAPRIVDVIAAGTSLRLTQRSDYASFIVHNNESIQALLDAMKKQVSS
ncbi:MAG TPA: ABC transporter substrate-binding protein [Acetobacteraceae bacterium]|nr:ABC transporter substrate-binding protein [Acetobacteraceae bacterium]